MKAESKILSSKRTQKLLDIAYAIFLKLYRTTENIHYNGLCWNAEKKEYEDDTYGHYLKVNGKLYTVDVCKSIEDFGYNDVNKGKNGLGICVTKFKHDTYSDDEKSAEVCFQVDPEGNFLDLYDVFAYYDNGMFSASENDIVCAYPNDIELSDYLYVSPGFNRDTSA